MKRWLLRFQRRQRVHSPLFALGELVVTPAARQVLRQAAVPLGELLDRHQRGDWGQVDEIDRRQNELGVRMRLRIRSAYAVPARTAIEEQSNGPASSLPSIETVWVVTSPDRLRTSVFLPRDIFDDQTS